MRKSVHKIMLGLATVTVLSACSTVTEQYVSNGDWEALGHLDGIKGEQPKKDAELVLLAANTEEYQKGYTDGLDKYCNQAHSSQVRARTDIYDGVCDLNEQTQVEAALEWFNIDNNKGTADVAYSTALPSAAVDPQTGAVVLMAPNRKYTSTETPDANSQVEMLQKLSSNNQNSAKIFALQSNDKAGEFDAIGGRLSATVSVDHVSESGDHRKDGSFSTVIGQVSGSLNQPLKIVYRKLPTHEHGSLYWTYGINAIGDDYNKRRDVAHNVFGKSALRFGDTDPADGIELGDIFSYDVTIEGDNMHLEFIKNKNTDKSIKVTFDVNIAKGQYDGNKYDSGYKNEGLFFKAGNENLCNESADCKSEGMEAGDYARVSFYKLSVK